MRRWEYLIVAYGMHAPYANIFQYSVNGQIMKSEGEVKMWELLNFYGEQGWEAVGTYGEGVLLKRPRD
jgi:hypothetical protein